MGRCTFIFLLCIGTLGVSLADDLGKDITLCQDPNEEFVQEKSTCPGDSCMALVIKIDCRNAPPPQPGCVCRSGYLRLNESEPTCGTNEDFIPTKSECKDTCSEFLKNDRECFSGPYTQFDCRCKLGFLRKDMNSPCKPWCDICDEFQTTEFCLLTNQQGK
ncbi:hypothetical protein ACJJTC_000441 [Scirpophaga incertulas]